jgi:hypothetical protein
MRQLCVLSAFLVSASLAACASPDMTAGDDTSGDDTIDPPEYGFQMITQPVTIEAGQEITYCFYFTIDSDEDMGVFRWDSVKDGPGHHLIVYGTDTARGEHGTYDECQGANGGSGLPVWSYAASSAEHSLVMPEGVGVLVEAQQHYYVEMHFLNAGTSDVEATTTVTAEAYAPDVEYVRASPYITYNDQIDLDPGETATFGGNCALPSGVEFFQMSTHAHKRAIRTEVQDGSAMVFESEDWAEPVQRLWDEDYYAFSSGSLTYSCTYTNNESFHIGEGQSAATDEMCMAIGWFFPSNGPKYCYNSFALP